MTYRQDMQSGGAIYLASVGGPLVSAHLYLAKDNHPMALAEDSVALTVYEQGELKGSTGAMPLVRFLSALSDPDHCFPLYGGLRLESGEASRFLAFLRERTPVNKVPGRRRRLSALAERVALA
jgi:hypothetical protein